MTISELLITVLVISLITFATRLFPFLVLNHLSNHPLVQYLAHVMPPLLMMILLCYMLKGVTILSPQGFITLIAIFVTGVVQKLKSNALISIFVGTGLYMLLIRL